MAEKKELCDVYFVTAIEAAAVATAATTARKSVALAGAPLLPVHIHIPIPSIPISSTVYNFQHIDFQPNRMTQEKQNGRKKYKKK